MYKSYIFIGLLTALIISCTDLDLQPANADVDEKVFTSVGAYQSYLAKIYAAFSFTGQQGPAGQPDISIVNDEGFTSYIRVYWKLQELTTDEAITAWTDGGIRDLHALTWSSENQFVRVVYYRIFYIIAYANDFLTQSADDKLTKRGIGAEHRETIKRYRAEVRFLRALAYWHALDVFRNVPLLTRISTSLPAQATPQELFNFIETELTEIEGDMAPPRQNEYGRADQAALWMLKAKLYLNAEVHIGEQKYAESATYSKKVIDAGYTLAQTYAHLFLADNHIHASTELIFTLPQDGVKSRNWGATTFLVSGSLGEAMTDNLRDDDNSTPYSKAGEEAETLYGTSGAWAGTRTTSALVRIIENDPRAILYTNRQTLEIDDVGEFKQGYAVPKWKNVTSTGAPGKDRTHADVDFVIFRLADAYLMYAEALLRNSGSKAEAVTYINRLRERAYKNTNNNITTSDLTLDFLLNERARELYWEGHRRIDLIRFNKYTSGIWPWKGGIKAGKVSEKYQEIFPIPASDIISNPRLKQNQGY